MTTDITPEAVERLISMRGFREVYAIDDTLRALSAALTDYQKGQTYRYIGKNGLPILARDLEDQRDAAVADAHSWQQRAIHQNEVANTALVEVERLSAALVASQAETAAAEHGWDDQKARHHECWLHSVKTLYRALDAETALQQSQAETAAAYEVVARDLEDQRDAAIAALTASQAETAAAYEVAADSLLECIVWCDNQERADDGWRNGVIDARKHHANRIRTLTPADSKAALARMIADAEERGMRKALDAASDYTQRVYGDDWKFLSNPIDRERILAPFTGKERPMSDNPLAALAMRERAAEMIETHVVETQYDGSRVVVPSNLAKEDQHQRSLAAAIRALPTTFTDAELLAAAMQFPDVRALIEALRSKTIMDPDNSNSTWLDAAARAALAPFKGDNK
jgi:hypothetical protein